ncbi:MAG: ribonuclease D [Thiogranum sp.]
MSSATSTDTAFETIATPEALAVFCDTLQDAPWLALDTEFIREKTFYPKLCLIQIAIPGHIACIDPLRIDDLTPVLDLLYNPNIVKILHACSQDLEIFFHLKGDVPRPVFDTQLAAPLLGLPEQIGYGNFVAEMLGVTLDKAQARTDWSRRPLETSQLSYAADDVRYLAEIYPKISARLSELGRLEWLNSEFAEYESIDRYQNDPADAWKRLRGLDKLRPRALAIIQLLAEWREQMAQHKDLPRNWIIRDDVLIDIARLAPDKPEKLGRIRNLQAKTVERYGAKLISLVQEGSQRDPQHLPGWKKRSKPTAQEEALADILHAQLRLLADKHRINSTVLASRKGLLELVRGDTDVALLQGWRREMAGAELLAICAGQRLVSVDHGQVVISEKPGA